MKKHTIYKIYYNSNLVYIGRTNQPLQNRLRGHFFGRPMHRKLDLENVTLVEYAELPTEADMYLYEIYLINKLKPLYNSDDKSRSVLTVVLPEIKFRPFELKLRDKWLSGLKLKDERLEEERQKRIDHAKRHAEYRAKRRSGEITQDEYHALMDDWRGLT